MVRLDGSEALPASTCSLCADDSMLGNTALRALIDITPERIAPAVTSLAQAANRPKKTDPSGAPDKPIWRLASGQIRQYRSA
ncbi:hypothetical protein DP23_3243 [Ralstonia pickettii]|nr:hypothetical protein DP23_3243 [Ralstonia pickettii]